MDREQFCSLPPSIAFGCIFDLIGGKLQTVDAPKTPMSPQWDMRLRKKGGMYIWASECDLESLNFFYGRSKQPGNPEFAEKNKKESDSLGYWVRWRQAYPTAIWSGVRGKKGDPTVSAKPPVNKPTEYAWEERPGSAPRSTSSASGYDESPSGGGYGADDDSIPF